MCLILSLILHTSNNFYFFPNKDENLDRMIPISKQPKEKIQAIIDSCTRQFPEFSERARKRIRTYLKSCRRNKKTREGWETTSRPTPAHLTSVQAEQLLAIACENESMNAKRMRIGLDPISQSAPQVVSTVRIFSIHVFVFIIKLFFSFISNNHLKIQEIP